MSKKKQAESKLVDFEDLFKSLEREFGEGAARPITERKVQNVPRFSTGLLTLDEMLGGGMPFGRIVEIFGPESSGKTSLCLSMVAAAQAQGITTAFIDAEHALDTLWAAKLGVDVPSMLFDQPMSGEKALSMVQALVKSGKVGLIIVDSVAALTPLAEANGEIGEAHIGRLARLMSQAMRMLSPLAAQNNTTIIFTNQIRMNIGVMFGSPETTPGGNALKFFSSIRLDVRRTKVMDGDERTGDNIKLRLIKSKVSKPYQQAEIVLKYDEGFDLAQEILDLGVKYELVRKSGSWYYYGEIRMGQGEDQAKAWLLEHPSEYTEIRNKLLTLFAPKTLE